MATRLASIGPRTVHQPITIAIYDQLQESTDWDYVAGADLAALTGGNTINITSRHHKLTTAGATIDNIADAAGASAGQVLELYCTNANTFRNNGGGAGNIRTISGQDVGAAAGQVVSFVYDGTNWREFGAVDAAILTSTATQLFAGAVSTGPPTAAATGTQTAGIFVSTSGLVTCFVTGGQGILRAAQTVDTQFRIIIDSNGVVTWGPGGSTVGDTTLSRAAAGALAVSNKLLEAAPATTNVAGGGTWTPSFTNGLVQRVNATSTGAITVASPGTPPAGFSGIIILILHNSSGGTVTVSANAIYAQAPSFPATGAGLIFMYAYNPGTSKWEQLAASVSE